MIDEVEIMFLYEGNLVQNGNMYHFEDCKGKNIELSKTITYEELLKNIPQDLQVYHNHLHHLLSLRLDHPPLQNV